MYVCAKCGQLVEASYRAGDPAVTSSSLGRGIFHLACFREAWEERRLAEEQYKTESTERRRKAGKAMWARRVQKEEEATT